MAKQGSPESVGERAMFALDVVPFGLPGPAPVSEQNADASDAGSPPSALAAVSLRAPSTSPPAEISRLLSRALARLRQLHPALPAAVAAKPLVPSRATAAGAFTYAISTELDRGIAFLLAPVFLAAGALIYFSLGEEPGFLPLAASISVLIICAFAARARPALHMVLVAALLCILGALLAKTETWRAGTKMLGGEVTTQLSGRIAEVEQLADGRVRLTIDVTGTDRPVLRYAPDRVRVSARSLPQGLVAGAAITGLVRLMPPSGPVRPGSYDFSFESYFDGIGASGFFLRGPELAATSETPTPVARFRASVERARNAVADRIRDRIGGSEGEIAAALVVGVRAGIPEDVNEALRRAGIYHIISISGLHMALVAGTIMVLLRAGFALFPDFSSRHAVKKYAAALAIVGLAGYLFISGAEVAAQRSFIMLAVMLTAVLFDRAALTMRNLAIAAIVVIALSPHEVVGPSFQMSFAATAALVGAYAAWSDWRADHPGQPPANRWLVGRALHYLLLAAAGLAVTSIVAGGATAIYAAWHFQQMPSLGLFTNLTAMPIVSAVVMPMAVLGALAMPFGLDGPFFHVMGLGLSTTIAIARWFSERSPADIVGLIPPAAVAVLTVALLIATIFSTWLRIAAVPVALAGLLLLIDRPQPDLLVSEDGRLVGLDIGGGRIAVNRARPNEFTINNWQRAVRAGEIVRPEGKQERQRSSASSDAAAASPSTEARVREQKSSTPSRSRASPEPPLPNSVGARNTGSEALRPRRLAILSPGQGERWRVPQDRDGEGVLFSQNDPTGAHTPASTVADTLSSAAFVCAEGLCLARHPSGAIIAHAVDAQAALDACATASVIVIDDVTAKNVCRWKDVLIVTKRDLALNGSAAIAFLGKTGGLSGESIGETPRVAAAIEYAISRPFRPWHEHRRFSREARGLPAYKRPDKSAKPEGSPKPSSLAPDIESSSGAVNQTAPEIAQ